MPKTYYLFNPGRMSRKENTLMFTAVNEQGQEAKPKYLPIEDIEALYIFGSIDANSALFNFLGKAHVPVHFFDFYEHYTGSFEPKDHLLAGKVQIAQTKTYLSDRRRLYLAQQFVDGATYNMLRTLKYYQNRKGNLEDTIMSLEQFRSKIFETQAINELMGIEGNCKQVYYDGFQYISPDFPMDGRHKRPPSNEMNALISFGNSMCYTLALDMIYHTQLNPTISFLHEPGFRRYSLALDIAEVFKPIFADRTIFKVLNKQMIKTNDFERNMGGCFLKESGKKVFIQSFEERLKETIQHRKLNKKVSYKRLVWQECHKIVKYVSNIEKEYDPFKIWW